jgi:hypothetical protein
MVYQDDGWLGRNQLPWAQSGPFSLVLLKAQATHHVPFHFYIVFLRTNVDIDTGFGGIEIRMIGKMCLFMLAFYRVIGEAPIDIFTINANAHSQILN